MVLAELRQADQLDWSRAVIDAPYVRALKGGGHGRKSSRTRPERAASTTWSATPVASRLESR
jgi:hypothetical protein